MNIRFSTLLAVLLAAPVAAVAQTAPQNVPPPAAADGAPAPHHAHGAYMSALHQLDLSPDQRAQIRQIVRDGKAKNEGVTDPQVRRANTMAMRQSIEGVLTPDQRSQFKTIRRQMRQQNADQGAPAGEQGTANGGGDQGQQDGAPQDQGQNRGQLQSDGSYAPPAPSNS